MRTPPDCVRAVGNGVAVIRQLLEELEDGENGKPRLSAKTALTSGTLHTLHALLAELMAAPPTFTFTFARLVNMSHMTRDPSACAPPT